MDRANLTIKQTPLNQLSKTDWEAVVVGAGPAGSSAARALAKQGHEVLLIDKAVFPRRKVCGDGLIADSIEYLKSEGLYEQIASEANLSNQASIISPSGYSFNCPGRFMVLKRERLDHLLVSYAVDLGAEFAQGGIKNLRYSSDGSIKLSVDGENYPIKTQYLIITTGGNTTLAVKAGLGGKVSPYAFAMGRYLKSSYSLPNLILQFDSRILPGYAWVWPMGDGLYNIGAGATFRAGAKAGKLAQQVLDSFLTENEIGKALLKDGEYLNDIKGAPLRCNLVGAKQYDGRRILAAGETIGTTYSFTGEGIGKAMATGRLAGETIAKALEAGRDDLLARYEPIIKSEIAPKYRTYQIAENWFSRVWSNDLICRRLGKSDYLLNKFAELADDRASISMTGALFSFLRSFVR